jgi:hypothetical protein
VIRREMPTPCIGSGEIAFNINRPSVPRRRSVFGSVIITSYRKAIAASERFREIARAVKGAITIRRRILFL